MTGDRASPITPPDTEWETALIIEAEDFATLAIGGPIPDGWNIWQTGRITDWVDFQEGTPVVRVTTVVRGSPANGNWPIMGVTINQRFEAHTTMAQQDWTARAFDIPVDPGVRQIGITFTNDEPPEPGQDRNLYVDRLEIAVPKSTPAEAWPVRVAIPDYLAEPDVPATDTEVIALAKANIEQFRKGDFKVLVRDATGHPVVGREVRFNMFRHDFLWGSAVRLDLDDPDSPLERLYRRNLGRMFNYATTENLLRWGYFEPKRGEPRTDELDQYVRVCESLGIELKAHNLVWGHFQDIPEWFTDDDIANAHSALEERIRNAVPQYQQRIGSYDVVNEPLHALQWEFWAGPSYIEDALTWTRESDPNASLIVNEFEIVAVPYMADNFFIRMQDAMDRGGPLDGVGVQLHSNIGEWYLPSELWRGFERMAQLGVDLHLTEVSLGSEGTLVRGGPHDNQEWNDVFQAEYYEQVMTVAFGHPHLKSVTFWGFTDRKHFQPGSGLLDIEMKRKLAGDTYVRLLEEEWSTDATVRTNAEGFATFRGFYGTYRVTTDSRFAVADLTKEATINALPTVVLHPICDGNSDNQVNESDIELFAACHSETNEAPVLAACAPFDADASHTVDCSDWEQLVNQWTSNGIPEFGPCTMAKPTVVASGSRYLTITPPSVTQPIALYVSSPDWLCVDHYVNVDGLLQTDPVYLLPEEWGEIDVSDPLIVPDATYEIQADTGTFRTDRASASTWLWGDIDNDGDADEDDIVLVVDAFHGDYSQSPYQSVDVAKCVPNRGVDLQDVTAVIEAVDGQPYSELCPDPCNVDGQVWAPETVDTPSP